jgi:K+-transporting ATPase ATPase C chain
METIRDNVRAAIVAMTFMTILCGIIYPMGITLIAELGFPHQARGSLIERDGLAIGSELIGQPFDGPGYLWGRPSATGPLPNTAFNPTTLTGSSGSNLGPTNAGLIATVGERVARFRSGLGGDAPVPSDLVTASGSGLDPHISPAGAERQVARIAAVRGAEPAKVREILERHTLGRTFGVLGEPRVNVLEVNIDLDRTLGRLGGTDGKAVPSKV